MVYLHMPVLAGKPSKAREFSRLPEGTLAQLIDGEIVMSPAPKSFHQQIVGNLYSELWLFLRKNQIGKVYISPIDVRFSENESYQPDIVFIENRKLDIIHEWGIDGVPTLVIEVLALSTAYYDLTHKKRVYEESGVKEYLVIDPMELTGELFRNDGNSAFVSQGVQRTKGKILFDTLPGFIVELEEIFKK